MMSSAPVEVAVKTTNALVEDDFNEVDWQGRGALSAGSSMTPGRSPPPCQLSGPRSQTVLTTMTPTSAISKPSSSTEEIRTDEWYQTSAGH